MWKGDRKLLINLLISSCTCLRHMSRQQWPIKCRLLRKGQYVVWKIQICDYHVKCTTSSDSTAGFLFCVPVIWNNSVVINLVRLEKLLFEDNQNHPPQIQSAKGSYLWHQVCCGNLSWWGSGFLFEVYSSQRMWFNQMAWPAAEYVVVLKAVYSVKKDIFLKFPTCLTVSND